MSLLLRENDYNSLLPIGGVCPNDTKILVSLLDQTLVAAENNFGSEYSPSALAGPSP